jgi:hypothetical protein
MIQLAMVEIVAEGTAEEENVVKVEMIKTLSILTIQLLYYLEQHPPWPCQSDRCVLTVTGTRLS